MYWIAYVTLGLAVGAVVGYLKGHKQGYGEGIDACERMHQNALSERSRKASVTRKSKARQVAPFNVKDFGVEP